VLPARCAYLVLAHQRPRQLRMLLEAISDPRDLILLHVDLKSLLGLQSKRNGVWAMARDLARHYPNVLLMRPRFTNWGGWSLSQLMLDGIELALHSSSDWTHLINLSGQCYPIKPIDEIRSELSSAGDQVFVQLRHLSTLPDDDWHLRWHSMVELPHRAIKLKRPRTPPSGFELEYKGSQWCILPRSFCEWQRQAPVAQQIRRYLRGLLLSDELIVQTLVRNGPWRDKVATHYGREIVWPGPRVMTMADWPLLMASPALFARKFDHLIDAEVVPALAREFGLRLPEWS
jgi:hypothetical protein